MQKKLWSREFTAITSSTLFSSWAHFALLPTLPLYLLETLKFSSSSVGLIIAAFPASVILVRLIAGYMADNYNRYVVSVMSLSVITVGYGVYPLACYSFRHDPDTIFTWHHVRHLYHFKCDDCRQYRTSFANGTGHRGIRIDHSCRDDIGPGLRPGVAGAPWPKGDVLCNPWHLFPLCAGRPLCKNAFKGDSEKEVLPSQPVS